MKDPKTELRQPIAEVTGTVKRTDGGLVIEVTEKEAKRIHSAAGGMTGDFAVSVGGAAYNVTGRGKYFHKWVGGEKVLHRYYYVVAQ